ncbi:arylsulfatase [Nocardia sp. NPDC019395]|uniref:arylsulfatase n=1 Tax=Nocardia sp. NPDC019395 TaxID=3154686 RepID=UPI0033C0B29B
MQVRKPPNVVVVLLDDCGFAQLGCFGAPFGTPNIDSLAEGGIRHNAFHVTALCSPSRAALLTGRNHHAVGMGLFPETPTNRPGYSGRIPGGIDTLPGLLRTAGYSTFAVGKWHLTPRGEQSSAGPHTRWPLGMGFDRYYGFLGSEANMWAPNLTVDNHHIPSPGGATQEYHLTEDLADQAIRMITDQQQGNPDRPFFLYFTPAAPHAPHHVADEWSDQYRGAFDEGWDVMRQRVFERQIALGVVPEGTTPTSRPSWVPAWEDLNDTQRALYARMQEVFAGLVSHTDHQIGRLVRHLEELGIRDDTVIMVLSDNGASAEGGPDGTLNETGFALGVDSNVEEMAEHISGIGSADWYNHYSWGWAWAGNTPFHLWKRYSWLGGTRVPFVVNWRAGLPVGRGEVASGFNHMVDILPTICEMAGVDVGDIELDGRSFLPVLRHEADSIERTQYFEMVGTRSLYKNGWKATTDHVITGAGAESELVEGSRSYETDTWHLFDLTTDFSEARDVADSHPEIVADLEHTWWEEARRNNVLPLIEGSFVDLIAEASGSGPQRTHFVYRPGTSPIHEHCGPVLSDGFTLRMNGSFGAADTGVICAQGDWNNGWAVVAETGRLHFVMSRVGVEHLLSWDRIEEIGNLQLTYTPNTERTGGEMSLHADGVEIETYRLTSGIPPLWQYYGANLCVGYDEGIPVSRRYSVPHRFTGRLDRITIDTKPLSAAHVSAMTEAVARGD